MFICLPAFSADYFKLKKDTDYLFILDKTVQNMTNSDPEIVIIKPVTTIFNEKNQIQLRGINNGLSFLNLTFADGKKQEYQVIITNDKEELKNNLFRVDLPPFEKMMKQSEEGNLK